MVRFDKAKFLSFLLNSTLLIRLSYSLSGSDVLLFLAFINIVSILCHTFIEFIIFLYSF